jgi:hypothetical protein
MTSGIYVYMFDNILVNTEYEMYKYALKNPFSCQGKYSFTYEHMGIENFNEYRKRNVYCSIFDVDLISSKSVDMLRKELIAENFYKGLEPSDFGKKVLADEFLNNKNIEKIYILIDSNNEDELEQKNKVIKKHFTHNKIVTLPMNRKNLVTELNKIENWNVFITDNVEDVVRISEATDINKKEFIISDIKYNQLKPIHNLLILEKGGLFSYANIK